MSVQYPVLVFAALVLAGCGKRERTSAEHKASVSSNPSAVDVRTAVVQPPQLSTETTSPSLASVSRSENALTTVTQVQAKFSGGVVPADPNVDIGYEGLSQNINRIYAATLPVLVNPTARLTPESANEVIRETGTYMKSVQHAKSVEKELRHDLWDLSVDINAAFREMVTLQPGPRYDALREIALQNIETIQRRLSESQ